MVGHYKTICFILLLSSFRSSQSVFVDQEDLDKLNLIWWFDFRIEPIFATFQKNLPISKVVKSDPKGIMLLLLSRYSLNLRYLYKKNKNKIKNFVTQNVTNLWTCIVNVTNSRYWLSKCINIPIDLYIVFNKTERIYHIYLGIPVFPKLFCSQHH